MKNFALSTDSCCDELKSSLKRMGIHYIPMCYIYEDEINEDNFDSFEEYKFFYDEMRLGKQFSTTGLNPLALKEYFEDVIRKEQKDIIHISLSSGLSGTCGLAMRVADEINETSEYKVYVVDSLSATQGQNLVLYYANQFRKDGLSAEEAKEKLTGLIRKLKVDFILGDLEALKRGGRINPAVAMIGKMVQLKPALRFNAEGKLVLFEKILGTKKAMKILFDRFVKNYDKEMHSPVYIPCTSMLEEAREFVNMLNAYDNTIVSIIGLIGPVIGSHTGSQLLGLIYISKNDNE